MNPNAVAPFSQLERRAGHHQLPPLELGVPNARKTKRMERIEDAPEKLHSEPAEQHRNLETDEDHTMSVEHLCQKYQTNVQTGLTEAEANRRLQQQGYNRLTGSIEMHWSLLLLQEMVKPMSLVLWLAAALCFVAYGAYHDPSNLGIGLVLCFLIISNGVLQFASNRRRKATTKYFPRVVLPSTIVIREGTEKKIPADELVRGDIIKVQLGKKMPADVRIIKSLGLRCDHPLLGESVALCPESTSAERLHSKNMAFFSTCVREGSGSAVVVETGDNTYIGKYFGTTNLSARQPTTVSQSLAKFSKWLSIVVVCVTIALFVVGFGVGYPAQTNLLFAIGMLIAGVPEGLLFEVFFIRKYNAVQSAKHSLIPKSTDSLERLSQTTCIVTGCHTLTQSQLQVRHLWYDGNLIFAGSLQRHNPNTDHEFNAEQAGFKYLIECVALSTSAVFDVSNSSLPSKSHAVTLADQTFVEFDSLNQRKFHNESHAAHNRYEKVRVIGDKLEAALLRYFQHFEDIIKIRQTTPVAQSTEGFLYNVSYTSDRKYAYSIYKYPTMDSDYCIFARGSPQALWKLCTHVLVGGRPVPKVQEWDARFRQLIKKLARNGQKFVAFTKTKLPRQDFPLEFAFNLEHPNFPLNQQCFVGLASVKSPLQKGAVHSITKCKDAGIRVVMVSESSVELTTALANELRLITQTTANQLAWKQRTSVESIIDGCEAVVVTSDDIRRFELEERERLVQDKGRTLKQLLSKKEVALAASSQVQHLRIAKAYKELGETVAVIGLCERQSLEEADVGVAIQGKSTDIVLDAAEVILQNESFSTLVNAIERSRCQVDNLKKAIAFALTSEWARMLPYIGLIAFQFPLPISAATLLYVSLITDLVPALTFACEEPEANLMYPRRRNKESYLISGQLIAYSYGSIGFVEAWGAFFAYYTVVNDFGFRPGDLNGKASIYIVEHAPTDVYNPSTPFFGNYHLQHHHWMKCPDKMDSVLLDWSGTTHASLDLRMVALNCVMNQTTGLPTYSQMFNWSKCRTYQISPVTNRPVCYSTEAMKYGQSAFLFGLVLCQAINLILCKTRRWSMVHHGMANRNMNMAVLFLLLACIAVAYFLPFNIAFNTRDNIFMHFGLPAVPFALGMLIIDELRKILVRHVGHAEDGKPNWWERLTVW